MPFSLPALVKIFITFAAILVLNRMLPLYVCLFLGSLLIGLWMEMAPLDLLRCVWTECTSAQTLWISLVIALILVLSELLRRSGSLERIVSSFQEVFPGPRFTLAAMPALIGLLPMPGGALFSAPMVEAALGNRTIKRELKVAINYWFRHIWEYWWPLYPGVVLAISLFGIPSWKIMVAQSPLSLGAVLGGILFIMPALPEVESASRALSRTRLWGFLSEVMPITLVIVVLFGLQAAIALASHFMATPIHWSDYLSLVLALVCSVVLVVRRNSIGGKSILEAAANPGIISMVMILFGIMAFKGMLVDSRAIEQVRAELAAYHIPPLLIIAILPFIAGLVTGIAIGFVGASFPLVVTLIPEGHSPLPLAVLAYGFGYMGMMLSPVHLCLLVTKEYFCADLVEGYTYLWKPALFGLVWTAALAVAYRLLLG